MFHVYILYSEKLDRYYLGHSEDSVTRLAQHNSGMSSFTSAASDWVLLYQEEYPTREAAHKREQEIKKKKSRKYLEWLIRSAR
jgi:putative endonuclease